LWNSSLKSLSACTLGAGSSSVLNAVDPSAANFFVFAAFATLKMSKSGMPSLSNQIAHRWIGDAFSPLPFKSALPIRSRVVVRSTNWGCEGRRKF
jgi:hypothetical protein